MRGLCFSFQRWSRSKERGLMLESIRQWRRKEKEKNGLQVLVFSALGKMTWKVRQNKTKWSKWNDQKKKNKRCSQMFNVHSARERKDGEKMLWEKTKMTKKKCAQQAPILTQSSSKIQPPYHKKLKVQHTKNKAWPTLNRRVQKFWVTKKCIPRDSNLSSQDNTCGAYPIYY